MQALDSCDLSQPEVIELVHDICLQGADNQLAAYKMGLTSAMISMVEEDQIVLKALSAMCAHCELAREQIVMKLKNVNLNNFIKSKYTLPLLLSLSRGTKILKQIICEETVITSFLRESINKLSQESAG